MKKKRVIYHPAKCSKTCKNEYCPYTHCEAWSVGEKYFQSFLEADNYIEDQLTAEIGDNLISIN